MTQARLSRDRVLDRALRLADDHGLEALTMRRLAAGLGVEAMSLYNHVPGKAALLSGMLERALAGLEVPADPSLPWQERLRRAAVSFLAVARTHPCLIQLMTSQHTHTPAALAPTEAVLDLLREAGFTDPDAVCAYQTLTSYLLGFIMQQAKGTLGLTCCSDTNGRGSTGHTNAAGPAQRAALPLLDGPTEPDAGFDFGLDLVLAGLAARLKPH